MYINNRKVNKKRYTTNEWCRKRMEISWTDHVRNKEVLLRVKEHRNVLHEITTPHCVISQNSADLIYMWQKLEIKQPLHSNASNLHI
jgi:hypothetical protein